MKNSNEQKAIDEKPKKHNLRLVWKNDNPPPKNNCRLEFIGELMPYSDTTIPVIKNLPWFEEEKKNESND